MESLNGSKIDFEDEENIKDLPEKILDECRKRREEQYDRIYAEPEVEPIKTKTEEDPKPTKFDDMKFDEPEAYEEDDEPNVEGDKKLSYEKLMKFIAKNHPVDDEKQNFSIMERITVKDYLFRLINPCGLYKSYRNYTKINKYFREHERGIKPTKKFSHKVGPDVSTEQPLKKKEELSESDMSNDEGQGSNQIQGITQASLRLGPGAVLYLQTLKTLAILFFILMILNGPIYLFYS